MWRWQIHREELEKRPCSDACCCCSNACYSHVLHSNIIRVLLQTLVVFSYPSSQLAVLGEKTLGHMGNNEAACPSPNAAICMMWFVETKRTSPGSFTRGYLPLHMPFCLRGGIMAICKRNRDQAIHPWIPAAVSERQ